MKRLTALVLILTCLLGAAGCQPVGISQTDAPVDTPAAFSMEDCDIAVSYANCTGDSEIYSSALNSDKMAMSSVQHIPIYKFDTLDDLEQFKLKFKRVLTMDYGYDEIPSFEETTAAYDEAFFDENTLMLVYVEASSGSYRFGVRSISCDGDCFRIHVEQVNNPAEFTEETAGWFLTVAVPDSMIENCTEFDADLNNSFE